MANLLLAGACWAQPALAQPSADEDSVSRPVVQPIPNSESLNLNAALARLGQNPRDTGALLDAGNAALAIGDIDAAIGFFRRADQISPGNGRVKAGLASAMVRSGNPFDAIPLFAEAERLGAADSAVALDRALAYDLVGDNATAQRFYRQTLAAGVNDEATRRLALSQAIAGDRRGAETTLSPLLQRQDKVAWRTRAFALAILGQADEAVSIANATLPAELAAAIAPYLRYMPRLTAAQQAAAANFGSFPRASEIGRDDPRVAAFAQTNRSRPTVASADAGLIPRGEPLGRRNRSRNNRTSDQERQASASRSGEDRVALAANTQSQAASQPGSRQGSQRQAPPVPQPGREAQPAASIAGSAAQPVAVAAAPAQPAPPRVAAPAPVAAPASVRPAAQPVTPPAPAPGFDLARVESRAPGPAAPAAPVPVSTAPPPVPPPTRPPAPKPPEPPAPRQSMAEAFSDLGRPQADTAPTAGAVDVRRIRPTREAPASARPAPPSHPSRIWVQMATGRDKAALGYDWRRMSREAAAALRGKRPFVSAWGQTNRLLTGPFESEAAANAYISQLRRADVSGAFVWTSPAGQVVDALPVR